MRLSINLFIFISVLILDLNADIHVKYADRITAKHVRKMSNKYGLKVYGSGGGMIDDVKHISLDLSSSKIADIQTARFLIVSGITDLLEMVNSSKLIRPHLHNYPFTFNNLSYKVNFYINKKYYPEDKIAKVSLIGDTLIYSTYSDNRPGTGYETVYEEKFEDAVDIVKNSVFEGSYNPSKRMIQK